jgi:hypothetical protein
MAAPGIKDVTVTMKNLARSAGSGSGREIIIGEVMHEAGLGLGCRSNWRHSSVAKAHPMQKGVNQLVLK